MTIAARLSEIKSSLPSHVTLVAVSKTKPAAAIKEALHAGHLHFGENKVQELNLKAAELSKEIQWHLIGHLQRNKVKQALVHQPLIHSIDSFRLLQEVEKQAQAVGMQAQVLLQVYIAQEETKYGLDEIELKQLLESLSQFKNIQINGLMGMASFTSNELQVAAEFRHLRKVFEETRSSLPTELQNHFQTLSMGMSGDYQIAIQEGSTMVRIGSAIFGSR